MRRGTSVRHAANSKEGAPRYLKLMQRVAMGSPKLTNVLLVVIAVLLLGILSKPDSVRVRGPVEIDTPVEVEGTVDIGNPEDLQP